MRASVNTYLLTCVTQQRRAHFTLYAAPIAMDALHYYAGKGHYDLHAAVIMPDHLHALITPIQAIERCAGLIKGGISFRLRKQIPGTFWQDGYDDRRILDDQQFVTAVEYIRRNPERRGLRDWEFMFVRPRG